MKQNHTIKRLLSLVLTLGMALALAPILAVPARAAEGGETYPQITINPNEYVSTPKNENDENYKQLVERFEAYQIFVGGLAEGFNADEEINELTNVEWGKSIQTDKQDALLDALGDDPTPARNLGFTYDLMEDTKGYYLGAENLETYTEAYETAEYWVDRVGGTPTAAGKIKLEAAFNADLENLRIGNVFKIALEKNDRNGAATAAKIITDFTPATGNTALAQAFYAIVFGRYSLADSQDTDKIGQYKYLTEAPVQKSRWVTGTSGENDGYWGIGEWDGKDIHGAGNIELPLYLEPGYYMIKDSYSESGEDHEGKAKAAYMAAVYGYGDIHVKAEAPRVHKSFGIGTIDSSKSASYEPGETIYFTLHGTLPKYYYSSYKGYPYIFEDTVPKGLTFGGIVRVYVRNSTGLASIPYEYYLISQVAATSTENTGKGYRLDEKPQDDGTLITVSFPNLKNVEGTVTNRSTWATNGETVQNPINENSEIFVVYTATLNENANINGNLGDLNNVELRYANNPLWDPAAVKEKGTWDNAWNDAPTGMVQDFVRLYNFGVQLMICGDPGAAESDAAGTDAVETKSAAETGSDQTEERKPLKGAGFALKKGAGNNVRYALLHKVKTPGFSGGDIQGRAEYTYYLAGWVSRGDLDNYRAGDGLAVRQDGAGTGIRATKSWADPLEPRSRIGSIEIPDEGDYYAAVMTGEDGLVRIVGLNDEDFYYLEEVITPLDCVTVDDISIRFRASYSGGVLDGLTAEAKNFDYAELKLVERDKSGIGFAGNYETYQELVARLLVYSRPSIEVDTGGMGTAPFYIGGGALLAGAALILIFSGVKNRKPEKRGR